ncbi:serine/threonine-protein kinase [Isoptericola croceus]|uniref:serine/threonine-protein kinase n=1 Tax=Isoptericola croceus TaxID=3031406 RepID=UPI0023F731DA|nr:serine/threonine-protein kinase [Isoptericola croceus]
MSGSRPPSAPPEISGFDFVSLIGSGGFSDVFLYQQRRPRRRVAIKVLLAEHLGSGLTSAFEAEADLMATLSSHPSIVTMHEADVTPDGRPFLVMEYCPRPTFGARYRRERLGVADVLRVGIQIAGALETAHRLGILHRDVKPANVLVTDYGHPALTDFGISSRLDGLSRSEGMSIPWSPPEAFEDPPRAGIGTDVWGLAATVYSLLASRTPFEVIGGSNQSADLVSRIERSVLQPTGRADVPPSLEQALNVAMAKDPVARYPAALDLARALQQVQSEMSLPVTPIDLLDEQGHVLKDEPAEDEVGTRLRSVVAIDPRGDARTGAAPSAARVVVASELDAGLRDTVHRGPAPDPGRNVQPPAPVDAPAAPAEAEQATQRRRPGLIAAFGGATVLIVGAAALWAVLAGEGDRDAVDSTSRPTPGAHAPVDNLAGIVPPIVDLAGEVDEGSVTFTWQAAEPREGDTYGWRVPDPLEESMFQQTEMTTVTVDAADPQTCIEIVTIRDGAPSQSRGLCVP